MESMGGGEMTVEPVKVLTIAGSDSGGAAGLQADLKTFSALGAYGMSVVTVVTAQNSRRVRAAMSLPADLVESQLRAVFDDYGARAVKTGFIGQVALIERIATTLEFYRPPFVVVDPVLVDHKGRAMFSPAVTQAYRDSLLPLADLVTPNLAEAALLSGRPVTSQSELMAAASALLSLGPKAVLTKGLIEGDEMVDVLSGVAETSLYRRPVIDTGNTHGSGDTLAAAICVFLAQGQGMQAAVEGGLRYTEAAIRRAAGWRLGEGHGPLSHF
jgi:hydroxymethylpyrimidine kinase/phosphomethylpyrimidine kinase